VIEPFRLIHTRRGWEIDAGPVTPDGTLGTFLVDRVNSYTVLDAMFELPGNLEQLLVQQGTPVPVELVVPHETRWAVEKHADRSTCSPRTKHPRGSEAGCTSRSATGLD